MLRERKLNLLQKESHRIFPIDLPFFSDGNLIFYYEISSILVLFLLESNKKLPCFFSYRKNLPFLSFSRENVGTMGPAMPGPGGTGFGDVLPLWR